MPNLNLPVPNKTVNKPDPPRDMNKVIVALSQVNEVVDGLVSAGGSGFPLRKPGEKLHAFYTEFGSSYNKDDAEPTTKEKPVILAESWDTPGALRQIWVATTSGDYPNALDGFQEGGSAVRIFIDNDVTPVVDMPMGDFFMYYPQCAPFNSIRVGRTHFDYENDDVPSGAYRRLWMPFQKYLRVEIVNLSPAEICILYSAALFSTFDTFDSLGGQQIRAECSSVRDEDHTPRTPLTIADVEGSGQIEVIHLRLQGDEVGDGGGVEGNVHVIVDDEVYPAFRTGGSEDFVDGAWGSIPDGGYPAGSAGGSGSPSGMSIYRFFSNEPIFFDSSLKVIWYVGQPNQGDWEDTEVDVRGSVYYWSNEPGEISYTCVNLDADPIYEKATPTDGGNPAYTTEVDGVWTVVDGLLTQDNLGDSNPDLDVDLVLSLNDTALNNATGFWVQCELKITNASAANQEAMLWACPGADGGFLGQRVGIELIRAENANAWFLAARDGFGWCGKMIFGDAEDLTDVMVGVALKVKGTKIAAYWQMPGETVWHAFAAWETPKTGINKIGVGTWTADAQFSVPVVYPLKSVTS